MTDTANTSQTRSLTENLGMTDTATIQITIVSLTENLGITDIVTKSTTRILTENLGMTDTATAIKAALSLTENLGITDNVTTTVKRAQTLTENLGITDNVTTTVKRAQTLTENLGMTDTAAKSTTRVLTENLGMTDTAAKSTTRVLTENLGITDNVTTTVKRAQTLTENLGMTDTAAKSTTRVLTEKLGMTDTAAKSTTRVLTEKLGMTDTAAKSTTRVLTENLGITDNVISSPTKSLQERLGVSSTITFKGGIKIEAKNIANGLVESATYTIKPNPYGGSSLIIADGGANDHDDINNGRVIISSVPFGAYNVTMTTIPSSFNVLGNSTSYETHSTQPNGTLVFKLVAQSMDLATLPPTVITSAPSLNSTTYNTWTTTYSASIINETSTHTLNAVQDLPPIISVGNETSQLDNAILRQATVELNTSFVALTHGQTVIQTLGMQNYSLPNIPEITTVLPSIVTTPSETLPQFVASPPMTRIIDGQIMVIPVESDLIPSWGGLVQLTVQSREGASSSGTASTEWLVAETSPNIPSSIGTSGISQNNVNLFVDIKSPYEENGAGFDWSQSSNHATNPVLKVRVAKSSSLVSDSMGCPIMTGYTFITGTGWVQQGITISNVASIDANTCELDLTVEHFSRFSLSSQQSTTSSSGSTSSESGATGGGGGGGGSGGTVAGGLGGTLVSPLVIYEITYDVCEQNMVRIIAGAIGSEAPAPNVKIRTPLKEVYSATLAQYQPYAEANKAFQVSRYVYEATLDPKLNFFIVTAEQAGGRAAVTATYMVNMDECRNTIIVNPMTDIDETGVLEPTPEVGSPNIFDVKFQVNANKPVAATTVNEFLEQKDQFKVSAIVDSPTTIRRAELRVNVAGGNYSNYAAVKMDVAQLQNVTNAYVVSSQLPSSFLQTPAIVYWVHVINNEGKAQSSERYVIGVKPTYKLDARLELDTPPSKAQGTTYRPTAYVYNMGEHPLFGTVSLLVNDTVVYTSPEQLFNKDQSVVDLEWSIPEVGVESEYPINAQLNLYDKDIKTTQTTLKTFQATEVFPISQPISVTSITDGNEMVARVGLMYSSDSNPTLHYTIVSPDGVCVIGKSDSCLVKDSTTGHRGNTMSVELDGQIYRVRYSGQDSPLERFSITSVDPIVGSWNVALESDEGIIPEAHAVEDVNLKVKYRAAYTKLITVASD
jgi:uncharacterized membrane protein YgcG